MPQKLVFNNIDISLEKRNLIEASAGTGKTYSIAILVIRLILEDGPDGRPPLSIDQILMVTFTNYAVAELESRVRQFVREAYNYAEDPAYKADKTIIKLVDRAIEKQGNGDKIAGRKKVNDLLKAATLLLDEISVLTIHGFCRRALTEFAFDTGQIFGAQALTGDDAEKIKKDAINEFWRNHITTLRKEILQVVLEKKFNRKKINELLKSALAEKQFYTLAPYQNGDFSPMAQDEMVNELAADPNSNLPDIIINKLSQFAMIEIVRSIRELKDRYSLIGFDDMISNLHRAVIQNDSMQEKMQQTYKAVFIDEFQDTDQMQYEIFEKLFSKNTILFYIGDPKQSIYAFRKADIHTYFKAKNTGVDRELEMNRNFRSSQKMIEAMNYFFSLSKDPFHVKSSSTPIDYIPVNAPEEPNMISLKKNDVDQIPISVRVVNKTDAIPEEVARLTAHLLSGGYTIEKNGVQQPIVPSDIGILVKVGKKGKDIKKALSRYNIPAVMLDDSKILQSTESKEILRLLQAVVDIKKDNIQKALLSGLTGYTIEQLFQLNEENLLELFKNYQEVLYKAGKGVYVMMQKFMADFSVRTHLLDTGVEQGDRKLSNIIQISELLNQIQSRREYSPTELINWLKRGIDGDNIEGNEYEQRIERDDLAVNILTIHKSKGLEYNIVISPYLDMDTTLKKGATIEEYRDDHTSLYSFGDKEILPKIFSEMRKKQAEQENRRLLYVAITRAKYKCFIYRVDNGKNGKTSINDFLKNFKSDKATPEELELFEFGIPAPELPDNFLYTTSSEKFPVEYKKATQFKLLDEQWRKMSYSGLSPDHLPSFIPVAPVNGDSYDQFIFKELPKGAHTGNLLHYIFEHIDFIADSDVWKKTVVQALKRLSASVDEEEAYEKQAAPFVNMLEQVLNTTIHFIENNFSLNQVSNTKKINELEFDFPVKKLLTHEFLQLSNPQTPWQLKSDEALQGIMNGKIDLFFEHGGKYYILDWKSNHLGYNVADYTKERVWQSMADNNYHLQYHIYTVAVYQYLKLRKPDFDYERDFGGVIYLFLRGVRAGSDTGIFFHKPSISMIESIRNLMIEN